jgi:exodeoxyribonuclease-1
VEVTFTDTLRKHLAKKGFDPLMGARPMQRLIQDTIRRALADELLFGRLTEGGRLTVDIDDHTFLWHDYETFGADVRRDRPAQFAAIRTDAELNEIGEPLMIYCQPANDYLPDPAVLPHHRHHPAAVPGKGPARARVCRRIEACWPQPGTIGVGYNTIRFDDEITRFMFWRNLIDPYAREWQNQCGRWDLLDVVRMTYALRPEGITWPKKEDGSPSFKLEHLTAANGLAHEAAHDALSDVRATIALARLIRQHNPKLFDFAWRCTRKTAWRPSCACPPRRSRRGLFCTCRACSGWSAAAWP